MSTPKELELQKESNEIAKIIDKMLGYNKIKASLIGNLKSCGTTIVDSMENYKYLQN